MHDDNLLSFKVASQMTDEAGFLAAIAAAPRDTTVRMIYADWLEDRDDPRAELVRIEEEMGQLPVFSDRYWLLKLRRNELRAQAPVNWLETMGYGFDCKPLFGHGVPDGWKERWRLIRELVERWHLWPLGDVGGRENEIREVEARLGRILPPSVREWVAFAHDVRRSEHYHDVLRDVYQMEDLAAQSAVSLLLQAEGDYHWAVRHEDFAIPDPPVYGFHWDLDLRDESTFVPDQNNPVNVAVTGFALGYAMGYIHAKGGGFSTEVADSAKLIRDLKETFPIQSQFGQSDLFETDNILVRLSPSYRSSHQRITVEVARPLPREAIPAFLWDYTHNGGAFH
jgi:uncharacterized protein (TIGR02996 family)